MNEEQLQQQLAMLLEQEEQQYPDQIRELAHLTGDSEEVARQKIDYMEQIGRYPLKKYVIADILLTYHRIDFERGN